MNTKDEIARLRAEAKHFRVLAAMQRTIKHAAKERHDPIGALKAQCRITEYVRAAQQRDGMAKELRARIDA